MDVVFFFEVKVYYYRRTHITNKLIVAELPLGLLVVALVAEWVGHDVVEGGRVDVRRDWSAHSRPRTYLRVLHDWLVWLVVA